MKNVNKYVYNDYRLRVFVEVFILEQFYCFASETLVGDHTREELQKEIKMMISDESLYLLNVGKQKKSYKIYTRKKAYA